MSQGPHGWRGRRVATDRPDHSFDVGLQHERTALAWERTAIAMMVAGVLLVRYAVEDAVALVAVAGMAEIVAGGAVLLWSAWHYEELHGPLRRGDAVVHPRATRWIGLTTVCFVGAALVLAVVNTVAGGVG